MSDYRRLISYIYAYEGGEKGKNIGFAKIDMRGPQCRIQVNVKKVYVGSSDVGVYLLHADGELLLGRIFIRSGAGEFRTQVQSENIDGSGLRMEDCYGLTIHGLENAWQSYTTIWEDAVAQTAEIQLAEVTAENLRKQKDEREREEQKREELERKKEQVLAEIGQKTEPETEPETGIERNAESTEVEKAEQGKAEQGKAEPEKMVPEKMIPEKVVPEKVLQEKVLQEKAEPEKTDPDMEAREQKIEIQHQKSEIETALPISAEIEQELKAEEQKLEATAPWGEKDENTDSSKAELASEKLPDLETKDQVQHPRGPEDTARLAELDREENEEQADTNIWKKMSDRYPKVLAFDYDNGCEILSIKPQDIGLLPRETWIYGNNSFLLHGYYNYRHLILAKLLDPNQHPRYLLGVPGHYFSNEKYMASMFGFPHFVLARKQPQGDGRFGYWYTDIRL